MNLRDSAVRCEGCSKVIEDDWDECCGQDYQEVYKCPECGDWVEEFASGQNRCRWCESQMPEPMTWGMFYGYRRI